MSSSETDSISRTAKHLKKHRSYKKYSRSFRAKRQLKVIPKNQSFITSYFPHMEELARIIKQNEELKSSFQNEKIEMFKQNKYVPNSENVEGFLEKLLQAAINNNNKSKNQNRHEIICTEFCSYLFIVGGPLTYETLHANLKNVIPSPSTVKRNIRCSKNIQEGIFNFYELKQFLLKRKLPLKVWLSEDATGITGRVEYSPSDNINIGFVLPFENNGLPKTGYFKVQILVYS